MGHEMSMVKKQDKEFDGVDCWHHGWQSKTLNRFKHSYLWSCMKRRNNTRKDSLMAEEEPKIQKIYEKEIILGNDDCLLSHQTYLLQELISAQCGGDPQYYIKNKLENARKLRATGFDLSDKMLAHFMLLGLTGSYYAMIKEIDCSQLQLTSETVIRKIFEHDNKRYYCHFCEEYSKARLCNCLRGLSQSTREIRDGKEVEVIRNC